MPINGVDITTAYRDYEQKTFVESLLQIPSVGAKLFREQHREQINALADKRNAARIASTGITSRFLIVSAQTTPPTN